MLSRSDDANLFSRSFQSNSCIRVWIHNGHLGSSKVNAVIIASGDQNNQSPVICRNPDLVSRLSPAVDFGATLPSMLLLVRSQGPLSFRQYVNISTGKIRKEASARRPASKPLL